MANRQREFLMADNHYRAGRITIDDFKKKVLTATAGQLALLTSPDEDREETRAVIAELDTAGATVVRLEFPGGGNLPDAGTLREALKSAAAVGMVGLVDLALIKPVVHEAGCPVFVVPNKDCKSDDLILLVEELPASVALLGKGQVASAAKLAASVARR